MASQLSAVTIIAVPGAVFREGGNLLFLQGTLLGFVLAKILMAYLFVKPYYERMCPEEACGDTMGMSLHMHARDAGRPMPFRLPDWVGMSLNEEDFGPYRPVCEHFFPETGGFWWLEWGGALDTVHETTRIKEEVQRITLAVWDYLKNRSPLAEKLVNYEIDWMGAVPGKRESRRFEGDHIHALDLEIENDIAPEAKITASSVFSEDDPVKSWGTERLTAERMLQLAVTSKRLEHISLLVDAHSPTEMHYRLYQGPENQSTYPEDLILEGSLSMTAGQSQWVDLPMNCQVSRPGWHFLVLDENPELALHLTEAPPGKLRYYPRPEDPIRPNPFSSWTSRSLTIGMPERRSPAS